VDVAQKAVPITYVLFAAELDRESREGLHRAQARDRNWAGLEDGQGSNRQENASKMKMGQANFYLKEDRNCNCTKSSCRLDSGAARSEL